MHVFIIKVKSLFSPLEWLILIGGILGAFILAWIPLLSQYTFGYDQARDAFEAYSIWKNNDIKIIGPATDFIGVFHGVLWFYLLAVLYAIGNGNPDIVSIIYCILLFLTVPLSGYVSYALFKNKTVSIIVILLYAFSPLFQAFTRWFSNPVLSLFVMPFLLLMLWRFITTLNKRYAFWIGICYGMVIQSNFGYALLLLLIPLYWLIFRIRLTFSHIAFFLLGSLISLSTFIIAEIKFQGRATRSVIDFFLSPHTSSNTSLGFLNALIDKISDALYLIVFPFPKLIIILLIIVLYLKVKSKLNNIEKRAVYFLLLWISNIFLYRIFSTGLTTSNFVFAPSLMAICMLIGFLLYKVIVKKSLLIVIVATLIVSQTLLVISWVQINKTALSVQQGLSYVDEKTIVDYTYQQSNGQPFVINTVTNPLFINVLWAYIYKFYGERKYGYLPFWDGRNQEGYLGAEVFEKKKDETEYRYLIIEPEAGIPRIYIIKAIYIEDTFSDIIETKNIGNFIVQKRKYHPNKPTIATPSALLKSTILYE